MRQLRVVKPSDCLLLLGIPTTPLGFAEAAADRRAGLRDFVCARRFDGLAGYDADVIAPFEAIRPMWSRHGVQVREGATSSDVRNGLRRNMDGVTIVFTHFVDGHVELYDGLHSCEEFAGWVAPEHTGIIDLCMCDPLALVSSIKRVAPRSHVCFSPRPLRADIWFLYYANLFRHLGAADLTYLAAAERTCHDMARPRAQT